jgi:hypothetical protein
MFDELRAPIAVDGSLADHGPIAGPGRLLRGFTHGTLLKGKPVDERSMLRTPQLIETRLGRW